MRLMICVGFRLHWRDGHEIIQRGNAEQRFRPRMHYAILFVAVALDQRRWTLLLLNEPACAIPFDLGGQPFDQLPGFIRVRGILRHHVTPAAMRVEPRRSALPLGP